MAISEMKFTNRIILSKKARGLKSIGKSVPSADNTLHKLTKKETCVGMIDLFAKLVTVASDWC